MFNYFNLFLSRSVTAIQVNKRNFQDLKKKKGGGDDKGAFGGKRREYAFHSCTHIEKVMQVDPGPVSVVMSPQWTVLLKSLFLLDNIWV